MPFYIKEGENWIPLDEIWKTKSPFRINVDEAPRGATSWVDIFPQALPHDSEAIQVRIEGDVIARDGFGKVYYSEQKRVDGTLPEISRTDLFIESTTSTKREAIIYSKKPIGKK